jgi:hypothetical protein
LRQSLSPPLLKRKMSYPLPITQFAPTHTDIVGVVGSKGLFWDQDFVTSPTDDLNESRPHRISIKSSSLKRQSNSTSLWALDELSKWNRSLNDIASASNLQTGCGDSRFWPRSESGSSLSRDDLSPDRLQVIGQVACI